MEDIYGAPGFSAPYDMTPEEFAEFLRRLASQGQNAGVGGGAFGGKAMSPAGTSYEEYGVVPPEEPVVDPRLVQKFMSFAQGGPAIPQVPQDLTGSYTANLEDPNANPAAFSAPTTLDELNFQRPASVYDLSSDIELRKQFALMDEARSKNTQAETLATAEVEKAKAETEKARAEQIKGQAEADNAKANQIRAASEMITARADAGLSLDEFGGPKPAAAPPAAPAGTPSGGPPLGYDQYNRLGETAQMGAAFGPIVKPIRPIPYGQGVRATRVGDYYTKGNEIWVWDGTSYQLYKP